jgi:hypothetical protein
VLPDCKLCAGVDRIANAPIRPPSCHDAGLSKLANLPQLTELVLNGTKVTDAGASQLDRFPNLPRVFLDNPSISPTAIDALKSGCTCCMDDAVGGLSFHPQFDRISPARPRVSRIAPI